MAILVEIAPGELIDKLTILEIKLANVKDETKLINIRKEYEILKAVYDKNIEETGPLRTLRHDLKLVNSEIWKIEDDIRDYERDGDFGPEFVAVARSVYRTNDKRAAIKREINVLLNSVIVEEKSYAAY